ncbi:MAG: hypothetical protein GC208_10435 [Alphaproteobacteria bacterium]|nr:hypothetical protein [Alphaproteobacteria bacterium]
MSELTAKQQSTLTVAGIDVPVVLSEDGEGFVVVRRVVEAMGIDWASQNVVISSRFPSCRVIPTTGSDGKNYRMKALPVSDFLLWLVSINANRVGERVRPILKDFQDNAAAVLFRWLHEAQTQGVDASSPEAAGIEVPAVETQLRRIAEKGSFKYQPAPVRGSDRFVVPDLKMQVEILEGFWINAYLIDGRPYFWPGDFAEVPEMTAGGVGERLKGDPACYEHCRRVRLHSGYFEVFPARLAANLMSKSIVGCHARQQRIELLREAVPVSLETWAVEANRARWSVKATPKPTASVSPELISLGDEILVALVSSREGLTINLLRKRLGRSQADILSAIRFLVGTGLVCLPEQARTKSEMRRVFLVHGAREVLRPRTVLSISCGDRLASPLAIEDATDGEVKP